MLQIPCPWCGVRDEQEFRFGGESHVARPGLDCSDAAWSDYLYNRTNPKGTHYERWLHAYGCGRWFNVARDTVTHEVLTVYRMGEPRPELPQGPPAQRAAAAGAATQGAPSKGAPVTPVRDAPSPGERSHGASSHGAPSEIGR